ncbi:hypothetical protein UFOVP154_1, partial [uncultured Caudovirales phage]
MTDTIISYKGFGADWKCRDFQYAIGSTYEHVGTVKACEGGFHACESPLDVLRYYTPAGSRFAIVEQGGVLARHDEGTDTKVASQRLTVKAEIDLPGLTKAAIEYTFSRAKTTKKGTNDEDSGAASATGY